MRTLLFTVAGCVAGYFAGVSATTALVKSQTDFEWARMLENHMVGPYQTTHPLRG